MQRPKQHLAKVNADFPHQRRVGRTIVYPEKSRKCGGNKHCIRTQNGFLWDYRKRHRLSDLERTSHTRLRVGIRPEKAAKVCVEASPCISRFTRLEFPQAGARHTRFFRKSRPDPRIRATLSHSKHVWARLYVRSPSAGPTATKAGVQSPRASPIFTRQNFSTTTVRSFTPSRLAPLG